MNNTIDQNINTYIYIYPNINISVFSNNLPISVDTSSADRPSGGGASQASRLCQRVLGASSFFFVGDMKEIRQNTDHL